MVIEMGEKITLRCVGCKRTFVVDANKPLRSQVPFTHTWGKGENNLRHITHVEWFEILCEEYGYEEACRMLEHES